MPDASMWASAGRLIQLAAISAPGPKIRTWGIRGFAWFMCGLRRLRKKARFRGGSPKNNPQGLKPCFYLVSFASRKRIGRCWNVGCKLPATHATTRRRLCRMHRPVQAQHDGWLLVALLESEEFGQLPFECIRSGRHIAQCAGSSGYRPSHRLLSLFRGLPPLIHGLGRKPWDARRERSRIQRFLLGFAIDVSPYVLAARRIAHDIVMRLDRLLREQCAVPAFEKALGRLISL
jgi:hypothetical protein